MCLYDFDGKKASNQCNLLVLFLYFALAGQINRVFLLFLEGFFSSLFYLFVCFEVYVYYRLDYRAYKHLFLLNNVLIYCC